jgi:ABC-type Mn2+/Zn2+ transport system permease subunit
LVAATVPVIGPLPVFAMMLGPPVMMRPVVRSARGLFIASSLTGALGAYLGAVGSVMADWPLGASAAIITTVAGGITAMAVLAFRRASRPARVSG